MQQQPRPNVLPPHHLRRQRQLDPTRQLTSRELWNQVRFHSASSVSRNNYYRSLSNAILYEIQPFRIKPALRRLRVFLFEDQKWRKCGAVGIERVRTVISWILACIERIYEAVENIDAKSLRSFLRSNSNLFRYGIPSCVGVYLYCRLLSYLHEWLHAGPMAFILTLLLLLYTVGLGENTGAASGVPSAYSVFNRGVQRLFGSEDAEQLAQQFVRAVAGRGLAAGVGRDGGGFGGGQFWVDEDEDLEENRNGEQQDVVRERRRRRRLERLQRRNGPDDAAVAEGDAHERLGDGNDLVEQSDNRSELGLAREDELANRQRNEHAAARKSGKKARRRNLEWRREMQRQRQAAAALGFREEEDVHPAAGGANRRVMEPFDQFIDD